MVVPNSPWRGSNPSPVMTATEVNMRADLWGKVTMDEFKKEMAAVTGIHRVLLNHGIAVVRVKRRP